MLLHIRAPSRRSSYRSTLLPILPLSSLSELMGIAHMARFNLLGALQAVDRANWKKFPGGKPQFNLQGKIEKPEGWEPANVVPFIKL